MGVLKKLILNSTSGGGGVQSVSSGLNINVDNNDAANPIVNTNKQITVFTEVFGVPALTIYGEEAILYNPNLYTTQGQVGTTDDTPTPIFSFASGGTGTIKVTADILAIRTGGAAGSTADIFATKIIGTFKFVAGVVTQVGTTDAVGEVSDIAGASASFQASGGAIDIIVTGAVDYNMVWNANSIKTSELFI